MVKLLKHKPLEDYLNNIQRELTLDEWNKAKSLYNEFKENLIPTYKTMGLDSLESILRHNNMCEIMQNTDGYLDIEYNYNEDVSILVSLIKDEDKTFLGKSFDIYIKGLDYAYSVWIDDKDLIYVD